MFGLFRKKEAPEPARDAQAAPFRELAARYAPEELSILAVTGASGFGAVQLEGNGLWQASIGLTAWMEADSPEIHRQGIGLIALADDTLRGYLRQRVPPDFIIKCKARLALDGESLLLLNLPEPGYDPDLKAILERQKRPESVYASGLGTFVLNRQMGWYQTDVDWLGQSIQLVYDQGGDGQAKAAHQTALALMQAQQEWDSRVRTYAAQQLPVQYPGLEDEMLQLPAGELQQRLEPESLQVWPDGSFEFWFHDASYQWEHALRVCGTVAGGPARVHLEG